MKPTATKDASFPLLRLPLELRRQIYRHAPLNSRNPSIETIYQTRLPYGWKDPPSPLLGVSEQVRAEVLERVQKCPIFLRVTHQGKHFDTVAETSFIAQQLSREYSKIAHLVIAVWPPHPERPRDVIDIWRHLRNLRSELRRVNQLQHISFLLAENDTAAWVYNGRALNLIDGANCQGGSNDVTRIMDLFARVRVAKASFHMPRGLSTGENEDFVRDWQLWTNAAMMGRVPVNEDTYSEEDKEQADEQDLYDEWREFQPSKKRADITRNKHDMMTNHGRQDGRLKDGEWEDFIAHCV